MNIDPTSFHRHSIRLKDYDYASPGAYFVTMMTKHNKCIFGNISNARMHLNDLGIIVNECWLKIPNHFPDTEVGSFVVMPNHIHGIITIMDDCRRGTIYRAPTLMDASTQNNLIQTEKFSKPIIGSIPTIIRTYKAAVSRIARRELQVINIWQRNYYEHIVRNQTDLEAIMDYILANPSRWEDDPEKILPEKDPLHDLHPHTPD